MFFSAKCYHICCTSQVSKTRSLYGQSTTSSATGQRHPFLNPVSSTCASPLPFAILDLVISLLAVRSEPQRSPRLETPSFAPTTDDWPSASFVTLEDVENEAGGSDACSQGDAPTVEAALEADLEREWSRRGGGGVPLLTRRWDLCLLGRVCRDELKDENLL